MFPDAELDAMRTELERLQPATAYILSVTRTSDGQGGFTESWGTASTVTCRLDHKRGIETIAGAALQPFSGWVISVPHDTALTTANRVKVGTVTYTVTSVDAPKSWSTVLRAQLEVMA